MQLKLKLWLQTQEIFLFLRRQEERKVVRGRDGRREREGDGREIGWWGKLSPNTGRRWADHRHNDAVLPCETRKGFEARWTWVQILGQPLSGV